MRSCVTFITNGEYYVGCTGRTVHLFDESKIEVAKFRDLIYAYNAVISPKGDIFVVRFKEGRLAVYDFAARKHTPAKLWRYYHEQRKH